MLLRFIPRRLWRERRVYGVLFIALTLVMAFVILGPLYARAVAAAEFEVRLTNLKASDYGIDILNAAEMDAAFLSETLDAQLGERIVSVQVFRRAAGVTCGLLPDAEGQISIRSQTTAASACYQPYAFDDFDSLFRLVAGSLPTSDPGEYAAAVITPQAQAAYLRLFPRGEMDVGTRFIVGEDPFTAIHVEIVGIVAPRLPADDPVWAFQDRLFGAIVPVSDDVQRVEFAPIFPPEVFENRVRPALSETRYTWRLMLDAAAITVEALPVLSDQFNGLRSAVRRQYPEATVRIPMEDVIAAFNETVQVTEQPIILMSLLILVLMIYNLFTTTTLILEQQQREWAIMMSRGGSMRQLVTIQWGTVVLLSVVALVVAPFVAQGILMTLAAVGPQADTLSAPRGLSIPANALLLGVVAAVVAVGALTLPLLSLIRRSLSILRGGLSRPPVAPWWARYFVDVMLLVTGLAFVVRLYALAGAPIDTVFSDPSAFVRTLAPGDGAAALNDPFNVLGPVLLLTGLALLSVRLFPLLMRAAGAILQRSNVLAVRLALWSVERDPGHYAQLLLLLVGALALGTASLALSHTRDTDAWAIASDAVGADVKLTFDPQRINLNETLDLPDSVRATPMTAINWAEGIAGADPVMLYGVDPARIAQDFPKYAGEMSALSAAPLPTLPGEALPETARTAVLDVYSARNSQVDGPVEMRVGLVFFDAHQVQVVLPMEPLSVPRAEAFITYHADLRMAAGQPPYRFAGLQVEAVPLDGVSEFAHTVYLDHLQVLDDDGEVIYHNSFADTDIDRWTWAASRRQAEAILIVGSDTDIRTDGAESLRVLLESRPSATQPPVLYWDATEAFMPVLISPGFARRFRPISSLAPQIDIGAQLTSGLDLTAGRALITRTRLAYEVVGYMPEFAGWQADDAFMIAPNDWLLAQANRRMTSDQHYSPNLLLVDLAGEQPAPVFVESVKKLPGLLEADYAWDRYQGILRDPVANALTGMLYAGYWVSLFLILLDFGFYLVISLQRRRADFAVLRALGWPFRNVVGLLVVEQAAFVTPALVVGVALGGLIAAIILPFLELVGDGRLRLPLADIMVLVALLLVLFHVMLLMIVGLARRTILAGTLRTGE